MIHLLALRPARLQSLPHNAKRQILSLKRGFLLLAGLLLVLPMAACGDGRSQEWDYSSIKAMPENWGGLKISLNPEVKTPDGKPSLDAVPDYNSEDQEWPAHLRYPARAELAKDAKTAEFSFWIKGEPGTQIALRLTSASAGHYTATISHDLTGQWQKIEFKQEIKGPVSGKWLSAPRLLLLKVKGGQHVYIGPMTFRTLSE